MTAPAFKLEQLDAVSLLASLPAESVPLIITDPAYESLEKHRKVGTTTRLKHSKASSNDWFSIFPNGRFPELFREAYRVLVPDAHLYVMCDQETMFVAKPLGEAAGFTFWKPLVWTKDRIGMGYHYRAKYELILFFEKGKRKLADLGVADVIAEPRIQLKRECKCAGEDEESEPGSSRQFPPGHWRLCPQCGKSIGAYPTEKPAALSEVLIQQSSSPGELVVDPFTGSSSVGVAAAKHGRRYLGGDTSAEAIRMSRARLTASGAVEDTGPLAKFALCQARGQLGLLGARA